MALAADVIKACWAIVIVALTPLARTMLSTSVVSALLISTPVVASVSAIVSLPVPSSSVPVTDVRVPVLIATEPEDPVLSSVTF